MSSGEREKYEEEAKQRSRKDLTLQLTRQSEAHETKVQELENQNQMLAEKVKLLERENQTLKHKLVSENQMFKEQKHEDLWCAPSIPLDTKFLDFLFDQETSDAHGAGTSSQHAHAHQV